MTIKQIIEKPMIKEYRFRKCSRCKGQIFELFKGVHSVYEEEGGRKMKQIWIPFRKHWCVD